MSSEVCLGWRVPTEEYEKFLRYVETERGDIGRYAWVYLENALREYMDADAGRDLEAMVDSAIQAGGYTPSGPLGEKKSSSTETLRGEETTLVNRRIDGDLRERFQAHIKEHTDFGTSYGLAVGYALREYRQQNRTERTTEKFGRFADDLADLLESVDGGSLPKAERETIEICRQLGEQFTETDLRATIEDVTDRDTEYIYNDRSERVLDRNGAVKHPNNSRLYVPPEEADRIRREDAEADAAEEMERLTSGGSPPRPAYSDGGRDTSGR